MFSENRKISMRQTKRLLAFDAAGISTLLLPPILAAVAGGDGIFCIFLALIPAYLYLGVMKLIQRQTNDYPQYMKKSCGTVLSYLFLIIYYICFILLAGYVLYTLSTLIEKSLLKEESFWLVGILVLLLAGYAILEGMEAQARIFEIMFWILLIPLIIMLVLTVKDVNPDYWTPVFNSSWLNILKGTGVVFLFYMLEFFVLFFLPYENKAGQSITGARKVLHATAILNTVIYLILLGVFGRNALQNMQYPVVTLMSMIKLPGGFFERQDSFMVAIWFFSLFALMSSGMSHGNEIITGLIKKNGKKRYVLMTMILTFAVAAAFYKSAAGITLFEEYIFIIGLPIIIIVPLFVYLMGKLRGKNEPKK